MSIAQHSIYTFIGKISQVIAVFVVGVILARAMGPEGNGTYELFQLIVTLSVTIGTLGVGHAMVYIIKRKGIDLHETFSSVLTFGTVWGITLGILVYAFYSIFPNILSGLPANALLVGAILIPFTLLDAYLIQGFLVELKIKLQSVLIIIKNILLIITMGILVWILDLDAQGIIYAVGITYILSSLVIITLLKKKYHITFLYRAHILKESLSFGIKNWLGNIFLILNYRLDMFLVNYYLGVDQVGLYSISVIIASSLFLIPSSIGPILYSTWSDKNVDEMDVSTPKKARQIVFIAFVISLIAVVFGKIIIDVLYGPVFESSYSALVILLPGVIMMTINYVLFNNFASRGKPIMNSITLVVALVINIVLNIFFIPKWGINGAALASTISYTFSAIVSIIAFYKLRIVKTSNNLVFITLSDIVELKNALRNLLPKR
ncbi:flippase [Patescibacteria group bacterium]